MASRFWVGGTGTWDAVTTTHWSATTGGAGGVSVPGSADTVTFDGASGGGTVTVNFGGTVSVNTLTMGAFTGTLDFSANNNSVTLIGGTGFSGTGTGVRTLNMGNGTWNITVGNGTTWNMSVVTNLTFNANSSTISLTGTGNLSRTFAGGGLTYNTLNIAANTSNAVNGGVVITGVNTFATLTVAGPNMIVLPASVTPITNAFTFTGTAAGLININGSGATISTASGTSSLTWGTVKGTTFSGGATFTGTNVLDLGGNTGMTITAPNFGGSGILGS